MAFEFDIISVVISAMGMCGCWLIVRPQAVENKILHKAIDNNTEALNRLTEVVNELKNDMVAQSQRVRTLEREMGEVRRQILGAVHDDR